MKSIVHKQNLEFLHHKSHYSFAYFQFIKNFLIINGNYIKGTLERQPHPTVGLICVCRYVPAPSISPVQLEMEKLGLQCVQLATTFLFHCGIHTKKTLRLVTQAMSAHCLPGPPTEDPRQSGTMPCSRFLFSVPLFATGLLTPSSSRTEGDSQSTCWNARLQR